MSELDYTFYESLGSITSRISKTLGKKLVQKLQLKNISVTAEEWYAISFLFHNNKQNQKSIVKTIGIEKVKVNRLINKLEEKDIVIRKSYEKDKRFNNIELTEKGSKCYKEILPIAESVIKEALNGFREYEIEQGLNFLRKICQNLNIGNND